MKNLDFLPNKQNKYAIRKYTVGTTSILLGAFLLLGTDDEAQAAENTTADATTALTSEPSSQPTPPTAVAPDTTISPVSDNVTTATATTIPETVPTASTTSTVAPTQPVAAPTATPTATGTSTSTTTPSNTSAAVSTTRLAAQPTTTLAAATTTGTNVNDLVTVSNAAISKTAIDPNQSGNFRLTANYTVDGKVQGGDYFTIEMPTYANINGELDFSASNNQFPINLYSPAGYVVANGVYDTTTKTLTYTFTDWVNDKENISGSFNLAQFADRKTALNSGTYDLSYNLAGENYNTQITYNYDKHDYGIYPASVDTMITSVDGTETTNTFKETIYVNPKDVDLSGARLLLGTDTPNSNAIINYDTTKLHIYRVSDPNQLTDSYYFDPTGYPDLAQSFYDSKRIYMNSDGNLEVNFGGIDTPYVVIMESQFNPNHSNDLSTRATLIATDLNNYTAKYYFDNGFLVETSSGSGDGVAKTYSLGDYVWEDSNQNGIQDAGETPISGVVVTLRDSNGYVVKTSVTDKYGNYLFSGLKNGTYTVDFVTPDGYVPTVEKAGTDTTDDSDGTSVPVTIDGADNFTIDSGFYKPTPEPTPVPATYNLGDYVWNDSNKDGIQNSNEVGIEGVTVTLTKADGTTVTTTTDASGKYVFTGLENGEYTITFTKPEGFEPTLTNVDDYRLDSNGLSTSATINNADNMSVDSGFYQPIVEPTPVPATYNLGNYVWHDSNKDGIQNSNEVGIEGVVVTLTKPDGTTVTTTTDASGKYVFNDLENGEYTVTFTTPEGFEPTLTNVGDNQLDSDGLTTKVTINNADNMSVDSGFYQPTVEPTPEPTPEP
ncbi:SdrD B-like domain-containing protein, partial [Staphylococcus hyicus]|uniref:SdrD B-like domain-containing protein n=1 Tax=Staphylococcus hyicus TaxID=1284 RepID=UPI003132F9D9